jgi:hypothetical protein
MAKKKPTARAERTAVQKMRFREMLYAMLQAAHGGFRIEDELLSDIPQATGTDVWIRWLAAVNQRFSVWLIDAPESTPVEQALMGRLLGFHELVNFADFDKTVDTLFDLGCR